MEIDDTDREQLGKLVKEGYTNGILDGDGYRVSWHLTTDKFPL